MTQIFKLLDKDFKAAFIIMLNEVKENMLKINKEIENLSWEIKIFK